MAIITLMRVLLGMFFYEVIIEDNVAHVIDEDNERVGKIKFHAQPPFIGEVEGQYWVREKAEAIKKTISFCMGPEYRKYTADAIIDHVVIDDVSLSE